MKSDFKNVVFNLISRVGTKIGYFRVFHDLTGNEY